MKKPLISLILPVYNAAPYLPACLECLAAQTWPNLEVIAIVDDGGDSSGVILDDFSRTHPQFHVIHQENRGVSRSRNTGLEAATGQYLAFCDADDLPAPDHLETLYQTLTESDADWSACSFSRFSGEASPAYHPGSCFPLLTGQAQFAPLIQDPSCGGYLWNKLFRRDLVEQAPALRMREDLAILEDLVFTLSYAQRSRSLAITSAALYGYRIHENSALHQGYSPRRLTSITGREATLALLRNCPENVRAHGWNDLMEEYAIAYKKLLGSSLPERAAWQSRIRAGFRRHRGQFPLDGRWNLKTRSYYLILAAAAAWKKGAAHDAAH